MSLRPREGTVTQILGMKNGGSLRCLGKFNNTTIVPWPICVKEKRKGVERGGQGELKPATLHLQTHVSILAGNLFKILLSSTYEGLKATLFKDPTHLWETENKKMA